MSANHIYRVESGDLEAFVGDDGQDDVAYCYGGARSVAHDTSDAEVDTLLARLRDGESRLKNELINLALAAPIFDVGDIELFPPGFLESRVGGARAIFRAKTKEAFQVLSDPLHPKFRSLLEPLFQQIGELLNQLGGRIKLTPDFGRFASVSDMLHRHTEHVLGVACAAGGCGGKASYTTTGILAAQARFPQPESPRITVIGANGALGRDLVRRYQSEAADLAVSDVAYTESGVIPPMGATVLDAKWGQFTDACLSRGGTIVAATVGTELEHSNLNALRPGTLLVLAHNLAVPDGRRGRQIMKAVADRGVTAVPGPLLTLGGALTSRLECFSRASWPGKPFGPNEKALAHRCVTTVCSYLAREVISIAETAMLTPHEAMHVLRKGANASATHS